MDDVKGFLKCAFNCSKRLVIDLVNNTINLVKNRPELHKSGYFWVTLFAILAFLFLAAEAGLLTLIFIFIAFSTYLCYSMPKRVTPIIDEDETFMFAPIDGKVSSITDVETSPIPELADTSLTKISVALSSLSSKAIRSMIDGHVFYEQIDLANNKTLNLEDSIDETQAEIDEIADNINKDENGEAIEANSSNEESGDQDSETKDNNNKQDVKKQICSWLNKPVLSHVFLFHIKKNKLPKACLILTPCKIGSKIVKTAIDVESANETNVKTNQILGIYNNGDIVDIYLPKNRPVLVKENQTLISGETIISRL